MPEKKPFHGHSPFSSPFLHFCESSSMPIIYVVVVPCREQAPLDKRSVLSILPLSTYTYSTTTFSQSATGQKPTSTPTLLARGPLPCLRCDGRPQQTQNTFFATQPKPHFLNTVYVFHQKKTRKNPLFYNQNTVPQVILNRILKT